MRIAFAQVQAMDYPPFNEAIARFQLFLNDQGFHGDLRWVFQPDVHLVSGKWFIRPRPDDIVAKQVTEAYEKAVATRLGVKLGVLCKTGSDLWCYIFFPKDQTEAEECMMPDGLKLSIGVPVEEGRIVENEPEWERLGPNDQSELKRWRFM